MVRFGSVCPPGAPRPPNRHRSEGEGGQREGWFCDGRQAARSLRLPSLPSSLPPRRPGAARREGGLTAELAHRPDRRCRRCFSPLPLVSRRRRRRLAVAVVVSPSPSPVSPSPSVSREVRRGRCVALELRAAAARRRERRRVARRARRGERDRRRRRWWRRRAARPSPHAHRLRASVVPFHSIAFHSRACARWRAGAQAGGRVRRRARTLARGDRVRCIERDRARGTRASE